MTNLTNQFSENKPCTHILYCYTDYKAYLENAVNYLVEGIEAGESVVLIESEKNMQAITFQLKRRLTTKQLENVHTISNFDFYLSSGSYHPPAIFENLLKSITGFLDNNTPFRTWTNVEWGTLDEPSTIVDWFEKETDKVVHEHNLNLICAYDLERMPANMQEKLEETHPQIMNDDTFLKSLSYKGQ